MVIKHDYCFDNKVIQLAAAEDLERKGVPEVYLSTIWRKLLLTA